MHASALAAGMLFAAGMATVALGLRRRAPAGGSDMAEAAGVAQTRRSERASKRPVLTGPRRTSRLRAAQAAAGAAGFAAGYAASGLWGIAVLAAGSGVLGPPFAAAPARRRRHTALALAWQAWARQLAELARAGAGLADALAASAANAPAQIAPAVALTARTARERGVRAAAEQLAAAGDAFEPDIAAGLAMAADSGGPIAASLDMLAARIGDSVVTHRARTEAVVALWTQTIALLTLAGAVIGLMYRNNPAYFDPYRTPAGQTFLVLIAMVLLTASAFLVRHSTVRTPRSPLAPPQPARRTRPERPPL